MEVGNGMGKTYRCEDNEKLGNNDQNQQKKYNLRLRKVNNMVGNNKSNDVDSKCTEMMNQVQVMYKRGNGSG